MKIPDTNPVPDALRHSLHIDLWSKLEAVIAAAMEAAAKGTISAKDAEAVISVGIAQAKQTDGRIYANASCNNVPDSVVEQALKAAASELARDELAKQAQELMTGYETEAGKEAKGSGVINNRPHLK